MTAPQFMNRLEESAYCPLHDVRAYSEFENLSRVGPVSRIGFRRECPLVQPLLKGRWRAVPRRSGISGTAVS